MTNHTHSWQNWGLFFPTPWVSQWVALTAKKDPPREPTFGHSVHHRLLRVLIELLRLQNRSVGKSPLPPRVWLPVPSYVTLWYDRWPTSQHEPRHRHQGHHGWDEEPARGHSPDAARHPHQTRSRTDQRCARSSSDTFRPLMSLKWTSRVILRNHIKTHITNLKKILNLWLRAVALHGKTSPLWVGYLTYD